jgi:hypothetical protein
MRIHQSRWTAGSKWTTPLSTDTDAQLVLAFGDRLLLEAGAPLADIRDAYPNARIVGCSTGGEICGERVVEGELSVAAAAFESSRVECVTSNVREGHSYSAGLDLARQLPPGDLVHVFVLASGLRVNGSELVRGLTAALPSEVTVTGGLAGDGNRFARTFTVWDDAIADDGVVAIGLYGNRLRVGFGSLGGWDSFGPERLVTRSTGTELFELDGTPALELYKRYLGPQAEGLPGSGMFFPLSLRTEDGGTGVVRTLLSIDEGRGSLTFAGEIPQGRYVRLMRGNFERLIDGAAEAARLSELPLEGGRAELAILVSCVGRLAVLGQRVEEEVEGVRHALGGAAVMTGFYSYGEIGPFALGSRCELHNQTMTVTTLTEL